MSTATTSKRNAANRWRRQVVPNLAESPRKPHHSVTVAEKNDNMTHDQWKDAVIAAVRNLLAQKGRYNTQTAYEKLCQLMLREPK